MNDLKYEYGCEITSTSECPLREEIRAEVIDEFLDKVKELYPNDSNALYKLMCIAGQLKEQNK